MNTNPNISPNPLNPIQSLASEEAQSISSDSTQPTTGQLGAYSVTQATQSDSSAQEDWRIIRRQRMEERERHQSLDVTPSLSNMADDKKNQSASGGSSRVKTLDLQDKNSGASLSSFVDGVSSIDAVVAFSFGGGERARLSEESLRLNKKQRKDTHTLLDVAVQEDREKEAGGYHWVRKHKDNQTPIDDFHNTKLTVSTGAKPKIGLFREGYFTNNEGKKVSAFESMGDESRLHSHPQPLPPGAVGGISYTMHVPGSYREQREKPYDRPSTQTRLDARLKAVDELMLKEKAGTLTGQEKRQLNSELSKVAKLRAQLKKEQQ